MAEGGGEALVLDRVPAPHEAADLIVAYLESIGVEYVFGIPGGAVEPLYNALARSQRRGGIRAVVARHETGAAFMAEGYTRETGKIGVCVATSGPGATNLITGVSCAYDNRIPMLVISGQPALPSFGRRSFQESGCTGINVVGMFRHCTGYNSLVSHSDQVETKLVNALIRAHQLQQPVHLSFPVDVLRSPVGDGTLACDLPALIKAPLLVDEARVAKLRQEIGTARRIVFVVGGGAAEAINEIMELVRLTGALFVAAPDGKGLINPQHPAYRGVFGFAGHTSASTLLLDAPELVVAIGTSMGEWNSGAWSDAVLNERLVHIDLSAESLSRTPMARLHVQGSILANCRCLLKLLHESPEEVPVRLGLHAPYARDRLLEEMASDPAEAAPIKPQRVMHELAQRCPPSTRFLAEPGNSMTWALHCLELQDRRAPEASEALLHDGDERRRDVAGWLRIAMDFCPMGWAIGTAVGVACGDRTRPVVCITGDGSYLMSGQEITVAAAEGLNVLFVILNDHALGMVKHGQRLTGAEQIAFELPVVDYRLMAEAMGIPAYVVDSAADFDALDFAAMFSRGGPTLIDVRIDGEESPPMNVRIKALTNT